MKTSSFTLVQTVSISAVFSAVSCWYGFMFGKESARKELSDLIETLRRSRSTPRMGALQLKLLTTLEYIRRLNLLDIQEQMKNACPRNLPMHIPDYLD